MIISKFRYSKFAFNPSSLLVAILLPTIILVTLPGMVIDIFLIFSFISTALLLVIMLENDQPLKVTFLPTIVLLITTFRLLLSIATTRNIIANIDVGTVLETVGQFVVGDNLVSGLLIFIIITIVQFLVVTKGGERVAEVGARFSLDALPGRQMTIDGDLKSGLITGEQAQKLRADLSTENKLYGSLDGAMKFVKGDAIAGILISLVNLFGGIYVGINHFELSLSDSVRKFAVLTVGDGLVSQIPSLLLSIACGVYLTRIQRSEEESSPFLGQVMFQIRTFWKSLFLISVLTLLIGIFTPTLFYVCLPVSIFCAIGSLVLYKKEDLPNLLSSFAPTGSGIFESLRFVIREPAYQIVIQRSVDDIEFTLWGQSLGYPTVVVDPNLEVDIAVFIADVPLYHFSDSTGEQLLEIMNDDLFIRNEDTESNIAEIVDYFLRQRLAEKYNLQYTSNIIVSLGLQSEVMKGEIDSAIGLNRVHDVLKQMIRSREFYLDKISFFEAMIYWSRIESEPKNWLIRIRGQARYEITARLVSEDGKLIVALLPPELTEDIEGFVSGEVEDIDKLLQLQQTLRKQLIDITLLHKRKPILIVNDNEINNVKAFFQQIASTIPICSHTDIADQGSVLGTEVLKGLG